MKYCNKRPPFDWYDAVAMECWLSDLAREGFIFENTALGGFRFSKGAPARLRYRVEPILDEVQQPSEEMKSAYEAAGWSFVSGINDLFFVWSTDRADASELHTDPVVQSEGYRRLCKKLTRSALSMVVCIVAMFALVLGGFLVSDRLVTLFLTSPVLLLLLVSELFAVTTVVQQTRRVLRIKKGLADGFALNHEKDYRRQYRGYRLMNWVSLLVSIAVLLTAMLSLIATDWRKSTVAVEGPLPYLSLDLIEQSADFAWASPEFMPDTDFDYNNYVDYTWSPLVPTHYEIRQVGAPQDKSWPDGSGPYTPKATTEYYRLAFSALAPALLEELMSLNLWEGDVYTIQELDAFDRTVLARDEAYDTTYLFVQSGSQVLSIRYQGFADLSQRLDLLADVLAPVRP